MAGLSFRRLLSHSRSNSKRDDAAWIDQLDVDELQTTPKMSQKKQRSISWISVTKKMRSSTESTDSRRIGSTHRPNISLPQIALEPAFSSTCSLPPSQEIRMDAFAGAPSSGMKAASSLCLPSQTQRHHRSLPPARPSRPSDELVIFPDWDTPLNQPCPRPSPSLSIPRVSQSDSLFTRRPAPRNKETRHGPMSTVEHLIQQTDEAFKAVDVALKDAGLTSYTKTNLPKHTPPVRPLVSHKHPASMPQPLRYHKDHKSREIAPPLLSPTRTASVMKPKPKKKKSIKRPIARGPATKGAQMRVPRSWTLPGNVADLLTGQRFKRIEADEMLTPERLEEMKKSREQAQLKEEAQKQNRPSYESGHSSTSENAETPVEPFHLEGLASRIGASGANAGTFLEDPSPCSPSSEGPISKECPVQHDSSDADVILQPLTYQKEKETSSEERPMTPMTVLPPPKNPARFGTPPHRKPLPSIPEVVLTGPDDDKPKPLVTPTPQRKRIRRKRILQAEEKDGLLYLYSTPFTLNNPLFRHGPIIFSKADLGRGVKVKDDTLDWTAFQMAILCGAGDLSPDTSWEEDVKQADDITRWFDSFGFETHGKLVMEDVPALSSAESSRSVVSLSPTIDADSELPIPVDSEYPSGFWNSTSPGASVDRERFFTYQGLRRWTGEGHPKPYIRNSIDSGPPSPMLPLVIREGALEGDDPVPMGYNLHHDLGEFLRWEAENVYASGYCGTP